MTQASRMMESLGGELRADEAFPPALTAKVKEINQALQATGDKQVQVHVKAMPGKDKGKDSIWVTLDVMKDKRKLAIGAIDKVKGIKLTTMIGASLKTNRGEGRFYVLDGNEGLSVYEVILKQRDRDSIEELIDKNGLSSLVETIAEIAFEKQEHIEQGDNGATGLSKSWGKDAKALDTLSARLNN